MAAAAKKAAAAPSGLFALGNVQHDGTLYEAGDALPAMDDEAREALRVAGVISAVPPVADRDPGDDGKP